MELFELISQHAHEQVVFCHEPACGYKGIIAIHNTVLGPALGGTRFWNYATDEEGFVDALRLSRGMTYKAAVAGLNLGGGKSVIMGDPKTTRREEIFRAHGRFVETLKGRYITAEDVNTSPDDMEYCAMETQHVTGLPGTSGDPSPVTAYGTYQGIKAAAKHRYGSDDLGGRSVTVQGVGHVGYYLCQYLSADGAKLVVTDIDQGKIAKVVHDFGATAVGLDEIYGVRADVYAPCALGATINDQTLEVLKVDIVAGAANNVLAEERHGDELHRRGVLYAPDYVINAGGLINVCGELNGWAPERSMRKAGDIYNTLLRLFELSAAEGLPTYEAADRLAEDRIAAVGKIQSTWV
ncbi:MAG TPA: Glu/Leu/Phe/Val dehydrogenase dimerization domain-containing protein [Longimicrobium sp.]|nr:Glu/Leu/Phe/Val dehydrogenase dimerization domain-containing protein [Longimicrobium sp.]